MASKVSYWKTINISLCVIRFHLLSVNISFWSFFLSNIVFRHTEHAHIIPIRPLHLPLAHKIHSSLIHKTCTTTEIPPLPIPPPQTKKKKSIIPLKQSNCKNEYTFKYLFIIWHQEQVYHKNIYQPATSVKPFTTANSESPMNLPLNDWKISAYYMFVYTYSLF